MVVRFGDFELDVARYELRRDGKVVPLERRIFNLIEYLVANTDRVVSKHELLAEVWQGRHVAEGSLSVAVAAARRALADNAASQRVIRTCHGRGYQFVLARDNGTEPSAGISKATYPDPSYSAFVGRSSEIGELAQAAARADRGQSTLLLISGEPGIGKTRLLDEFLRIAQGFDVATFIGRCAESGDAPAMWPWTQVFRSLHNRHRGDWTNRLSPRHASALAMVLPESLQVDDALGPSIESPEVARFQLYEGLLEALTQFIGTRKTLIALDDLHRADEATLGLLRFAARELRQAPVIFVGTHRISEVRQSPGLSRVLAELAREPQSVSIVLGGLTSLETNDLFERLCSRKPSAHELSRVYLQTGGNPFFIRQLAALLVSTTASPSEGSDGSLPLTLRHAILEQIGGLSQTARGVLATAAVIGREFSLQTLSILSGLDGIEFDAALDELLDSQVLRRGSDELDRLAFAHILVRDALYEHLGLTERRDMHERIARLLAAKYGTASETHVGEIAYHLFEAQTQQALTETRVLSETAARAAALRSAHDDAERHYRRALAALKATDSTNENEQCRLLLALGTEQCRSGNRSAAKDTFAKAARMGRSLGAAEDLARAALGVAPGFLAAEAGASDRFLEDLLEEALATVESTVPSLRARVAARLAIALHWSESNQRMREAISLARDISERIDDPGARLQVLFARWFCEWNHETFDERSRLADEIQSRAEAMRDREMILMGMMLRQVGMLERGEITAFDASFESFANLASELRQPQSLWYTPLYRSMRALLDGGMTRALSFQSDLAAVAARVEDANAFHSLVAQSSILHWEIGGLEGAIGGLIEGARRYPAIRGFRAAVAWAYSKTSRLSEARREFECLASADFTDVPERFDWTAAVTLSAEVACDLGDKARARSLYDLLDPLRRRFLFIGLGVASFGSADRLLGRLSETMGRFEQAEAHFQVAVERNAAAGAHAWTAHSKFEYALLLARAGGAARRDYRVRMASEALETATDLGLLGLKARAEAFLQSAPAD